MSWSAGFQPALGTAGIWPALEFAIWNASFLAVYNASVLAGKMGEALSWPSSEAE